jgi:hypothetical protein
MSTRARRALATIRRSAARRVRRPPVRIGWYALLLSIALHACLLSGFSIMRPPLSVRRQPAALLWLTRPRQAGIEPGVLATLVRPIAADVTVPRLPAAPAWIAATLARPWLAATVRAEAVPVAPVAPPVHWSMQADGTLAGTILQAWQRHQAAQPLPAAADAGACDLYVTIDYPSFARQVLLLRSSGDAHHDAVVVQAVRILPLPMPAGARVATPMQSRSYRARVRIAPAVEE